MPTLEDEKPRRKFWETLHLWFVFTSGAWFCVLVFVGFQAYDLWAVHAMKTSWSEVVVQPHPNTYQETPWGTPMLLSQTSDGRWAWTLTELNRERCESLATSAPPAWSNVSIHGGTSADQPPKPLDGTVCRPLANTVTFTQTTMNVGPSS